MGRRKTTLSKIKMKLGLYSITYLGCWYRGEALTLPELIRDIIRAEYGKKPTRQATQELSAIVR